MKLLITGICGFVGSSLAQYFQADSPDWEIYGIDNFIRPGTERNRLKLKRLGIHVLHADLRSGSDFETLPVVDAVIDAAANPSVLAGIDGKTSSRQLVEHNLGGTLHLLEYCKKHQSALLLLSTSRVYSIPPLASLPVQVHDHAFVPDINQPLPAGLTDEGLDEAFSTQAPVSLYGSTKLASEILSLEYGQAFNFPVWINRCGVLAGAGQFGRIDQGIFSYWLHSWKQKRPLRYLGFGGHGYQVRDCLHPDDLARLLLQQIRCPDGRERVIHVSGGRNHAMSLSQLSSWCTQRWHPHEVTSEPLPRPFDLPWMVLDSRRAGTIWNWKPQISLSLILEQISRHAEENPDWLDLTSP